MREKSALASVVAFEIMEADDDINIFVKDMNANDGERHPRGEKRRRVGNDQKVKVDDREQHWCEERGEKRRRVGHGQQRSHQRDQERSHQHDQERSVERDQERSHQRDQEGSVERDQERSHQRDRHRSVKRDQHRSVECDQQRSRQRDQQQGQEKVVGSDHPSKEQRGREEFITISDIETSFEFDGRLVGKRLVDANVATEIQTIVQDAKGKFEKERQNYLKVLSKTSKECEGLLKNEYTKFQATHDKFCKEKAAHMQTLKGLGSLIGFSRWRPEGHCRRLGWTRADGGRGGCRSYRPWWMGAMIYSTDTSDADCGGGRGGRLAYIGDATTGLGEGDDRDGRKRRSGEHWQKKRPWRKPEERGAPPSMDDGPIVSDSASSPATN
uniref:Myosin-like protein n=1 Tax=Oryza sativa subsp. japonica TaxID=39947 RepID=Q84ZN0_ORYSJ|nr:myosin-like protein [Oryza sativa Japonica Group]BAC82964.1 myosin-like protein [Oryza sativa Japonica Group]